MITQQSTIHEKYHGNTGYLLGNIYMGTQEFGGMGYCVDDQQTTWTDESQRTIELHNRITQTKMTSCPRIEMMNDAFGCSRATQVHMEDLRQLI